MFHCVDFSQLLTLNSRVLSSNVWLSFSWQPPIFAIFGLFNLYLQVLPQVESTLHRVPLTSEYFSLHLFFSNPPVVRFFSILCCLRTMTHFEGTGIEMGLYIEGCSLLTLPWQLKGHSLLVLLYFVFLFGRLTRSQTLTPLCQHTCVCVLPCRQKSQWCVSSLYFMVLARKHFFCRSSF